MSDNIIKIIAIGDIHFQACGPETNMFIEKMVELVDKENPDVIIIMGDVLHTHERINAIALNKAYEFIDLMRKRALTQILVGNHDFYNNQKFCESSHWMNALKEWKNVTIVDTAIFHSIIKNNNTVNIFLCPFVPPGRFEEALQTSGLDYTDPETVHCIFAHQEFLGVKMGAIESTEGDSWPEEYPLVISGHIHNKHWLRKNIYYCGSSMQHSFGDFGDNTIPAITWDSDGNRDIVEHDLGLPRKRIIHTDLEALHDMKIDDTQKRDLVRLNVACSLEEFKSFKKSKTFKDLSKKGAKIVCKPEKVQITEGELGKKVSEIVEDKGDFLEILKGLIEEEKDEKLEKLYREIVLQR